MMHSRVTGFIKCNQAIALQFSANLMQKMSYIGQLKFNLNFKFLRLIVRC